MALLFSEEEIEGLNCEKCQKQTTVKKGPKIGKLPPVLTFNLNRITLDYTTFERKKVNQRFEYPLELDMSKYLHIDDECAAA